MSDSSPSYPSCTTLTVPASLAPAVETLSSLLEDVAAMPRGGDLEGLIETHLEHLNRQCFEMALRRRQEAAAQDASAQAEGFPPSGVSGMPKAAGPRACEGARRADASR